jgi:hypothetical protein
MKHACNCPTLEHFSTHWVHSRLFGVKKGVEKVYKSVNFPLPFLCLEKVNFLQIVSVNLSYIGPLMMEAGAKS